MATNGLRYGLTLSFSTRPDDAVAQAVCAERLGFHSVWLGEHFITPAVLGSKYPYPSANAPLSAREDCFDTIAVAAAIAASTSRLRIATGIYLFPLRHPLVAARSAATLQVLSGKRFMLGVAGGWAKEEYDALGVPFEQRGERLDEGLQVFRKALAGGEFEHRGKHFSFDRLSVVNSAIEMPVIIGGASAPALRRAARLGDGWLTTPGTSVEECIALKGQLEAMRRNYGVAERLFDIYVRAPAVTPNDVEHYVKAGLTNIVVGGRHVINPSDPLDVKLASLAKAAKQLRISGE